MAEVLLGLVRVYSTIGENVSPITSGPETITPLFVTVQLNAIGSDDGEQLSPWRVRSFIVEGTRPGCQLCADSPDSVGPLPGDNFDDDGFDEEFPHTHGAEYGIANLVKAQSTLYPWFRTFVDRATREADLLYAEKIAEGMN